MKPLDEEVKRLIAEVNAADTPGTHAEERVWQALSHGWDKPLPPTAAAAAKASSAGMFGGAASALGFKVVVGAAVLALGGSAVIGWLVTQHERTTVISPTPQFAPAPLPHSTMPVAQVPDRLPEPQPEQTAPETPPPLMAAAHPAPTSRLLVETRLLADAQRALSAGMPSKALALLEQHRLRFAHGDLTPEREAARVFALCALGRATEAARARQRFLERWPGSPLSTRVAERCAPDPQQVE